MKINVISPIADLFSKQLPNEFKGVFYFNSEDDIVWDAIVVYENISKEYKLKHIEGGLFFISGEPPLVKSYSDQFLEVFDHIISAHSISDNKNHNDQQALPWYFGYNFEKKRSAYTFEELQSMSIPTKSLDVSFITSNRRFLPGHAKRMKFLNQLQSQLKDQIDFYGKGINEIDDKAAALLQYKFSICIENSSIDDYWTEKIADSFLAYTIPIYCGCKNLNKYFPENSYISIDINNVEDSIVKIKELLNHSDNQYNERFSALLDARNLLLHKYNIFPFIISYINKYVDLDSENIIETSILPYSSYPKNTVEEYTLKIKRIFYKYVKS